jgi:Ser/Thr protein kinase RdoA (MazF antagonist)
LPAPDGVADVVRHAYGLTVTDCVLVRSLVNDVYQVTTAQRQYAFKLYRHGGWSTEEVAWEQDLVVHLSASGVAVAPCVRLLDGRLVGELAAPEGPRPFALSHWLPGHKPQPPWTDGLYRDFGAAVARFHRAGDDFHSQHTRRPFDLERTLDRPLDQVLARLDGRPDDQGLVRELGTEARRRIAELIDQGLDWGIRHGDISLDNVHRTDGGLILHDFDLAGEGWRAADLTGVRGTAHWEAFLAGYTPHRPLAAPDLAAIGWLRVAGLIANLAFHLVEKPAIRGTESLTEGWVDRELTSLREFATG